MAFYSSLSLLTSPPCHNAFVHTCILLGINLAVTTAKSSATISITNFFLASLGYEAPYSKNTLPQNPKSLLQQKSSYHLAGEKVTCCKPQRRAGACSQSPGVISLSLVMEGTKQVSPFHAIPPHPRKPSK